MNDVIKDKLKLIRDEANVLLSGLPSTNAKATAARLERICDLAFEAEDMHQKEVDDTVADAVAEPPATMGDVPVEQGILQPPPNATETMTDTTATVATDTAAWDEPTNDAATDEPVADEPAEESEPIEDEAEPS